MRPRPLLLLTLPVLLGGALAGRAATAADDGAPAVDDRFANEIRPLFEAYCFGCHGPTEQKGSIRLDGLDPDFVAGGDAEGWHTALDVLQGGDMPPRKADQPTDDQRRALIGWIRAGLEAAARAKEGEARPVLRRLNRAQYTNTLRDLLGLGLDLGRALPGDGKSKLGFTNNGAVLQASPLHIDTYQQLARVALDEAIVSGPRPAPTRYRVRFGEGLGSGHIAARTGGYQAVPLNTDDFVIDVLDAEGAPRVDLDAAEQAALDAARRKISVGLRGSSQDRFRVVDEGLMLYGALPHREKAPGAWQGPSPNVKLEMQRVFPERGDVVMRVRASRGYLWRTQEPVLVSLQEPEAFTSVADGEPRPRVAPGAVVLAARASAERQNLRWAAASSGGAGAAGAEADAAPVEGDDGAALVPEDVTEPSNAKLSLDVPAEGYYQVDLVHPPVTPDAMPSIRLQFRKLTLDLRPELTLEQLARERVVTTIGAAYLPAGRRDLRLGGPFFTGFSYLVLTPLPGAHELVLRLSEQLGEREAELADRLPVLRAFAGTRTDDGMDYATFDAPQVVAAPLGGAELYEFHGRLEDLPIPEPESGDDEILSGFLLLGVWNHHLVKHRRETGPPLVVESIEVEAPYHPVWPPETHRRIFVASPHAPTSVGGAGEAPDEEAYTREVLAAFLPRAFRRAVDAREVDRYLSFWRETRADFERYEDSVREVLVAVLCSPHFLFLVEPEPEGDDLPVLDDAALATRLSFFLWNSPPDGELAELAAEGRLRAELPAQVARLLDDSRSARFVRAFTPEWLRLDRLDDMTVDVDRYPDFTRFVKRDMREETLQFFAHVLREDLSLFQLIESEFALLNQNLAEFYGVPGVAGPHFRPVPLDPALGRGGLLAQGAFLTGHSDGSQPHPVKRAVWIKDKILADPPPPPPPNVPDLDPDAPGFEGLTLKEQLERHRDSVSCRDCHAGIDPYGVAFERYDAVGRLHDERGGMPIDDRVLLPDGAEVEGVAGLKRYLLEDVPRDVTRSVVEHLFGYALGRDVTFADEATLDAIVEHVEAEGHRLRAVVEGIVLSPAFQN